MDDIYIKNKNELEKKIAAIKKDGKDNLHVIADFDRTLTSIYNSKGEEEDLSLFAKFRVYANMGEEYNKKYDLLYEKYYPIEMNHDLPIDYRTEMMIKWWSEYVALDVAFGSNRKFIESVLDKLDLNLRQNIILFFETLNNNEIPLLIFSAGIKQYISGFLTRKNIHYDNISIIANEFEFDNDNKLLGFKGNIIHTFNKDEAIISHDYHFKTIRHRGNIILLGDHLGDLNMAKGLKHKTKITIGFYNDKDDKHLQKYIDEFDVILCNDNTMDYVNNLLKKILL